MALVDVHIHGHSDPAILTALADIRQALATLTDRIANMPTPAQLETLIAQLDVMTSAVEAMERAFLLQSEAQTALREQLAADLAESDLNEADQAKTLAAVDRFIALNQRIFTAATNNTPAQPPSPPAEPPVEPPPAPETPV